MGRLLQYAGRYKRGLVWGAVALLLTNAATFAAPQLFRYAIDGIQGGESVDYLRDLALALFLIATAGAAFRVLSRVFLFYVGRDVEKDVRDDFYRHLASQPPEFFATHPTGDLMSRATYDLTQVRLLLGPGILNSINAVVAYAAAIPLMMAISPKLSAIALGIFVPSLYLTMLISKRLYAKSRAQQAAMGDMGNFVQENLAGAHVVRTFGMEAQQGERFATINDAYYHAAVDMSFTRSYMWRMMAVFASISVMVTLFVGAGDVMADRITLGELVAMIEYLGLLAWPSFAIGWVISMMQRGLAAMNRISGVLDIEPAIRSGPERPATLDATLKVRGLDVVYAKRKVLDAITLDVPRGNTLGVVGPIGSGKSTLVHALVRQIDIPAGTIFVGAHDITQLDLESLRGVFGFVQQNPQLFSKTVAENVAFGKPGSDREAVTNALRLAAFESDLSALPHGLDTPVGERGITLSGGQKQRTAIARALLLEPPVLVLDDALSSVDAETETQILTGLRELRRGKTTVIVAHRISAVQHAEEIIVLDEGRISERGTHAELVTSDGLYAQMARRQELERGLADLQERSA